MILPLGNARRLAAPPAQIIELGAPHLAAPDDFDGIDHGRIEREYALDPLAVGDFAYREILVEPGTGPPDAHALIGLDPGTLTLDHLVVDQNGVARRELRNILAGGKLGHLLLFELLNEVHGSTPWATPVGKTCAFWFFSSGELLRQGSRFVTVWRSGASRSPHERSEMRGSKPRISPVFAKASTGMHVSPPNPWRR